MYLRNEPGMLRQKLLVAVVLKLLLFLLWRSGGLPCLVRCEMGTGAGEELRCRWRLLLIPQPRGGSRQVAQCAGALAAPVPAAGAAVIA